MLNALYDLMCAKDICGPSKPIQANMVEKYLGNKVAHEQQACSMQALFNAVLPQRSPWSLSQLRSFHDTSDLFSSPSALRQYSVAWLALQAISL